MSKRIFTKEQIATLLQNPNVAGCSPKSISWRKNFKVLAMRKYHEGLPPSEIFRQARFDINMIGHETPKQCLRRWRKIFKDKGEAGLKTDGRGQNKAGGRPKNLANLTDEEKLKRLEAEVAYLKEENRFLAKLRKQSLNYGHAKNIRSSDH
jgi:transposase-like protein